MLGSGVRAVGRIVLLGMALGFGCSGGLHREGQHQIDVMASYGRPVNEIKGRAENAAVTVRYERFVRDRTALMAGITPLRVYDRDNDRVYEVEFQVGGRYYPWEFHLGKLPIALFGETSGGVAWANQPNPPAGTEWNLTYELGAGLEFQLSERLFWMVGYRFRHLSNAKGQVQKNPSQDDDQLFTGLSFSW